MKTPDKYAFESTGYRLAHQFTVTREQMGAFLLDLTYIQNLYFLSFFISLSTVWRIKVRSAISDRLQLRLNVSELCSIERETFRRSGDRLSWNQASYAKAIPLVRQSPK